jgi:hypothetical protein
MSIQILDTPLLPNNSYIVLYYTVLNLFYPLFVNIIFIGILPVFDSDVVFFL